MKTEKKFSVVKRVSKSTCWDPEVGVIGRPCLCCLLPPLAVLHSRDLCQEPLKSGLYKDISRINFKGPER